ncbi:endo-1,3(4)-beta-glucanase NDAI_0G02440 [Naumovozyma dairenensis CBS 421]|uniref:glucan endo-1,3-beta-D-glucosidase n=1 Tax=Naumovozyma dairenensis (strain ATCC 10597 / BCRC 20456 / CBS 421 / NBRC 0211 / NRRL Y-12639) TaxID=1071378 RepID=G0WE08_NAUDC|nr:hypothetical protein NDAI_0G02440 [Naumovozyma dairenensis CBS 421]CCD26019.2 hypothetical protein NDAI_0G02440 [Naumovozyma dairenensis CBS 421]
MYDAPPPYSEIDLNANAPPDLPNRVRRQPETPAPGNAGQQNDYLYAAPPVHHARYNRRPMIPPVRPPAIPPVRIENEDEDEYAPPLPRRPPSSSPSSPSLAVPPPQLPPRSRSVSRHSSLNNSQIEILRSSTSRPNDAEESIISDLQSNLNSMNIVDSSKNLLDFKLSNSEPLSIFARKSHEIPLPMNLNKNGSALHTNKFYANLFLGNQTCPIWTHPYSLWFSKEQDSLGIAINHIKASQRVFSDEIPSKFFFCPTNIKAFIFSSIEFNITEMPKLGFAGCNHMSIQLQLKKNDSQFIWFPLVQGMGFVTAIYYNLTPKFQSMIGFKSITLITNNQSLPINVSKYRILLQDDRIWTLYITLPVGSETTFRMSLTQIDGNTIVADKSISGTIVQIIPESHDQIDRLAGSYVMDCTVESYAINDNTDELNYKLKYKTSSQTKPSPNTLIFALPHHIDVMTQQTLNTRTGIKLDSTVMGEMEAFITTEFNMNLSIPTNLNFNPFTTIPGKNNNNNNNIHYTPEILQSIHKAAINESQNDILTESNLDSMYFSGKILAKYAWILYVSHFILHDSNITNRLLINLKKAIQRFISNTQILPLMYDTIWGGIISSGTSSQDFGNSFYNDHHFHYSYHVITASIIALVDNDINADGNGSSWLIQNKDWVECLIRDYCNPSIDDQYFPQFRSFDWFNGHSWAKGLFESGDGKDEESSSEDVNASYALKLWGLVTKNNKLEQLGNLQLGILRGSLNHYFLYSNDNITEPKNFIGNKVSGILFENKIDHTTYFGNELQYIQMIHAIPITPASSFIRSPKFVEEEWEQKLIGIVGDINDGWKGIIMLNVALFDPIMSFSFFNDPEFKSDFLDNGQSLTWSLAYSGAFY